MTSRDLTLIVAVMVSLVAIVLMFFAPLARAAERIVPGPHEITLVAFGKDYDAGRTLIVISGEYEDRKACLKALRGVRVMVTGMKAQCFPSESFRVR